ncbi:hypothetical protein [Kurthia sp. Dielmo]|uniref:hypothetical protein n=1 Tax=Kurthia sp. Dielmo TaxID=1033738 RepID=UPI001121908F|nr:hypothetical protein [Kurthia sp. Dielmo]
MTFKINTQGYYELKNACRRLTAKNRNMRRIVRTKYDLPEEEVKAVVQERLQAEFSNVITIVKDAQLALSEFQHLYAIPLSFNRSLIEIEKCITALDTPTFDYELFTSELQGLTEASEEFFDGLELGTAATSSDYLEASDPVYPESSIHRIMNRMVTTNEKIHTICNMPLGITKEWSIQKPQHLETYGINIIESAEAKAYYDHKAIGSMMGSHIDHDAFDAAVVIPRISYHRSDTAVSAFLQEYKDIQQITRYLRSDDGLLIYGIPSYRLSHNIATYLAKNYHDIQFVRKDRRNNDFYLFIIAKRNKMVLIEDAPMSPDDIRKAAQYSEEQTFEATKDAKYSAPLIEKVPKNFRGSLMSRTDIETLLTQTSRSYDRLEQEELNTGVSESTTPLLPFNTGQIGMVLTSGLLNGFVEEGNDQRHLVKGRTVRRSSTRTKYETDGSEKEVTISSSHVQIHLIMPDGSNRQFI